MFSLHTERLFFSCNFSEEPYYIKPLLKSLQKFDPQIFLPSLILFWNTLMCTRFDKTVLNNDDIYNKNYNRKIEIGLKWIWNILIWYTIVSFSRNHFTWDQILATQPMYIRNRKSSIVNTCTSDDIPSHYDQVIKFWAKKVCYLVLHEKNQMFKKSFLATPSY